MDVESFITLLFILLLVTTTIVIACRTIRNRKRQQQTSLRATTEERPTVVAGCPFAVQKPQRTVIEEVPPAMVAQVAQSTVAQEPELVEGGEKQTPVAEKSQPITSEEPSQIVSLEASQTTSEEIKRTGAKEAHPRLIQEIQPPAMTETSPPIAEEAQSTVAQEARWSTGKATQLAAEQMQSMGEGVTQKRPKPINRGGRPRDLTVGIEKQPPRKPKIRALKPEIVCWKRERQWLLMVEVPEEFLGNSNLTILQNDLSLSQDESEETCWRLRQLHSDVTVCWNEDGAVQEAKVELGHDDYLLFKLSGLDQGRLVKFPSSGLYLVIAPEAWERDEELSGPAPVAPEPVLFTGYRAHFFDLEKGGDQKIAFRLPDREMKIIESKAPRFELIGSGIGDASEHIGPLFGESPPRIRALDAQAWSSVRTIIVGEEGRGRNRWRMSFSPDPDQTEQDLPPDVADRKGGWYFLRFYNSDDDLIESLDFRFLSALRGIRLHQPLHLPARDGHESACVEFLHEADCAVQPVTDLTNIQIERQGDKTILTVPPNSACDESRWSVGAAGGPRVEVTINVERIWWAVGEENNLPAEWHDRPVVLSREDLKATSSKALWLQLPKRRWVDRVLVGFERSKARPYSVKVTERTVAIPLREFGDYPEVSDLTQECNMRLWIKRDHRELEGVLAAIPASHMPVPSPIVPSGTQRWVGLGRKKTAIAKAVIQNGAAKVEVNGRGVDEYFRQTPRKAKQFLERLLDLKEVREVLSRMEVNITVEGSSPTTMRQAKAVANAIARALMSYDHNLTRVLKQAGFGGVKVKHSEIARRGER